MNYPDIGASTLHQLHLYKMKNAYTDAQVADLLTTFGWTWQEGHVADLLAGRVKPTRVENEFFEKFLLNKFLDYNRGA